MKATFTSQITGRDFKLSFGTYDFIEMTVYKGRVTITVSEEALQINSFQDEQVKALLIAVLELVHKSETKVVNS